MLYIFTGISVFLLLVCYSITKKSGSDKAKYGTYICSLLVLICALVILYQYFFPPKQGVKELFLLEVSAKRLGEYLAIKVPNSKALVLTDLKYTPESIQGKKLLKGLKEGFGNKITIESVEVLGEVLSDYGPKNFNPRGNIVEPTFEDFDFIIEKYSNCSLIVFLSGLPRGFVNMALWSREDIPKIAIIDFPPEPLGRAIAAGIIIGVVSYKPNLLRNLENISMTEEDFSEVFDIVTPENIEELFKDSK